LGQTAYGRLLLAKVAVFLLLIAVKRAGLAGGEAVGHIQRHSCGLSANDRSGGDTKGLL
jgi:hypothetical protein